ncbi:AAA family ATPase [Verrucomicrobiota bacterium]
MENSNKTLNDKEAKKNIDDFLKTFQSLHREISKFIVGHANIIDDVLIAVICEGHVLLEGLPGLGKTALVRTLAQSLHLTFRRIQFTPDLLPADILGTNILVERDGEKIFNFQQGPVFTNVLLADEINRATPKTQSALLETMQERTVTVANTTHELKLPFFVLATQNPIEMDGTYPLPEAQLDRFFFKLKVGMPNHEEFGTILDRTGGLELPEISGVADGETILSMGRAVRQVPIAPEIQNYLIHLVRATHPENKDSSDTVKRYVRYGASPRAAQAMLASSRARALLNGRYHVSRDDVKSVAAPAMRHRIILNFEGEAEGITTDDVINNATECTR